jgi:hypothetical protein
MRTTTTTREGTYNRKKNYPLKMFLWHVGHLTPVFKEAYEKLRSLELREVVTDGDKLTTNTHAISAINAYMEGRHHEDEN